MKRRELLKASAIALGYTALGGATFTIVNGCKVDTTPEWTPEILSSDEMKVVSAVVDRIIPKTSTPGAIEAGIDRYLDSHLKNNFTEERQNKFKNDLTLFNKLSQETLQKDFADLSQDQQDEVLTAMSSSTGANKEFFDRIKQMTARAFFSSEIGATQVLNHIPVPGPYKGCIPLSETKGTYAI